MSCGILNITIERDGIIADLCFNDDDVEKLTAEELAKLLTNAYNIAKEALEEREVDEQLKKLNRKNGKKDIPIP